MRFCVFFLSFFLPCFAFSFPLRAGLVLQNAPLYLEKDLSSKTFVLVYEGSLVEIVETPEEETFDKDQNQTFCWFFVKIPTGESGWIFGNNLAVQSDLAEVRGIFPDNLPTEMQNYSSVFGKVKRWFAFVKGHDAGVYDTSAYIESYLVFTNSVGKSLWYPCGQLSGEGSTRLLSFNEFDVTGDQLHEIIVEFESKEKNNPQRQRWFEILGLQSGFIQKLYTVDLAILTPDGLPAPSLYKQIEIDPQGLMVEYLDFPTCSPSNTIENGWTFCPEVLSSFLRWEPTLGTFLPLYDPLKLPPMAKLNTTTNLHRSPDASAPIIGSLNTGQDVAILRFFEKINLNYGLKQLDTWAFLESSTGQSGYVEASTLTFVGFGDAQLFSDYVRIKPLSRLSWRSNVSSIRIIR